MSLSISRRHPFALAAVFALIASVRASSPAELQPNEVRVNVFFGLVTSYSPRNQARETSGGNGAMTVSGDFAARLSAPSPGKRTLTHLRRLPESVGGSFGDVYSYESTRDLGEGGWITWFRSYQKKWDAGDVPLSLPSISLEIDLDASTWRLPDFVDEPNRWYTELLGVLRYWGTTVEPDDSGQSAWRVTADPREDPPWITRTGIRIVTSPGDNSLQILANPRPLTRAPGYLSGTAKGDAVTDGLGNTASWIMVWRIYESAPELELRVTAPGFEDWRPRAGPDPDATERTSGPPLVLTAQVVRSSGGPPPTVRIRKLRWSLVDTSRLPGVAMNFPYRSQDTSPDLEIDHGRATDERQNLVLENLTTLKSTLRILPYDWGGWSTLRVEAELDDGRKLQGIYHGPHGDQTDILLPARDPDTKIARSWRKAMNATGGDDADEDQVPSGKSSVLGDGFSLFEEYRGFYVSASVESTPSAKTHRGWVSLHPLRHHLFVYDQRNDDDTRAAIAMAAAASGLKIYVIHPGERFLDSVRIMNLNRGAGLTLGDQHAIGISNLRGLAWHPFGGEKGRPGQTLIVTPLPVLFTGHTPKLKNRPDLYRRAIAQELLRGCGVPLAGNGDESITFHIERDPGGGPRVRTEAGENVTLRNDAGHDLGEDWLRDIDRDLEALRLRLRGLPVPESVVDAARNGLSKRRYYVARKGGQHSGPLGNIMRYTMAEAYRVPGSSTIIVLPDSFRETVGWNLSTTSAGDGYNDESAVPPRYGDSPNPPSAHSVVVNDHAP